MQEGQTVSGDYLVPGSCNASGSGRAPSSRWQGSWRGRAFTGLHDTVRGGRRGVIRRAGFLSAGRTGWGVSGAPDDGGLRDGARGSGGGFVVRCGFGPDSREAGRYEVKPGPSPARRSPGREGGHHAGVSARRSSAPSGVPVRWPEPRGSAPRSPAPAGRRPAKRPSMRRAFGIPDGADRLPGPPSGGRPTCRSGRACRAIWKNAPGKGEFPRMGATGWTVRPCPLTTRKAADSDSQSITAFCIVAVLAVSSADDGRCGPHRHRQQSRGVPLSPLTVSSVPGLRPGPKRQPFLPCGRRCGDRRR